MIRTPVRRSGSAARRTERASQPLFPTFLGLGALEAGELHDEVCAGLAYGAWESFLKHTGLVREQAAALVRITPRTLSRRKEEGRFQPDESDRLIRAARTFALAVELFEGNREQARLWFLRPQRALGGAAPVQYASTDVGAREVESLIGRLEHGIPS